MNDNSDTNSDEEDIRRLLQAAGRREELPQHLKDAWEAKFRSELAVGRVSRTRRFGTFGAIAAAISLIAVALLYFQGPAETIPEIRVVTLSGDASLTGVDGQAVTLVEGQSIALGARIDTAGDGLLALAWGAYDLRVNGDSQLTLEANGPTLKTGEIYVSDEESRKGTYQLVIQTPQGRITDIGTQYTVKVEPGLTVTTVRRGAVILDTGSAEFRTSAQPDGAQRLAVDDQNDVTRKTVEANGEAWRWIYAATPAFELDGRSAWDFLHWSVNESGLQLEFSNTATERYARSTRLHGNIKGLNPEQAIQPVLAATDLRAMVENGQLVVYLNE